jgi:hypothetical protein
MQSLKLGAIGATSALMVALFGIHSAYANWGGDAGGSVATGTFHPVGTNQVEMLQENLLIRLSRDRANVAVDYTLHNSGAAVDAKAGFPSLGVWVQDPSEPTKHLEIADYAITADGKPVAFTHERGDPTPYRALYTKDLIAGLGPGLDDSGLPYMFMEWLVSSVHFDSGQTRHVRITYESLYAFSEEGYSEDDDFYDDTFHYLLSTGAAWKGPIHEGRVTIEAATVDADRLIVTPKDRFKQTKNGLVWEFHDLKPSMSDNIEVNLNDRSWTINNDSQNAEEQADFSRYVAAGGKYYFDSHNYVPHVAAEQPDYPAANVRDYRPDTEWRTMRSPGVGETLALEVKPPAHIDSVGIMPGCGKDKDAWLSHSRIKNLAVKVNGKYVVSSELPDEYISFWTYAGKAYEWVDLPQYSGVATEITLTIREVYPGAKDQVTCISEVLLRQRLSSKPKVQSGVDGHELP